MKKTKVEDFSTSDYEWYEERKGKIKKVASAHRGRKRPVRNWKKHWSERLNEADEVDDFYR